MERITRFTSPTVAWPADDVDTDQVIPARFLKGTARSGWGEHLFADRRYDADGRPRPEFPLNRPEAKGARVLVAGRNFGCGSSREHAVWALQGYGFQAVIALSFADIFRGNALKNGLLPVAVEESTHARLLSAPGSAVTVDLEAQKVTLADGMGASFVIDPFARYCLLNGIDELQFLLGQEEAVAAYERRTGPLSGGIPS
ncbi:MAG: 3-isopropylmalate dehydratase small subunit [Acidobacteria bacterium]|nr:MAG: 3-isopropylmalate dehydratase small subunit [Acidobacteriota bacterium]